ncbi:MAG: biliverdin-producing heme oxygenase [Tatlockia sp.]|nr:biliverdin-producing heme oxygenase [Tatlockia sp.]
MGYLYVIEGATLGGQIIIKMIETQLQLTKNLGGRFFYGYGDKTKVMWDKFCINLNEIDSIEQQNIIITSANDTFKKLHKWLELKQYSETDLKELI